MNLVFFSDECIGDRDCTVGVVQFAIASSISFKTHRIAPFKLIQLFRVDQLIIKVQVSRYKGKKALS